MTDTEPGWRTARLDVGCGPIQHDGWFGIDRDQYAGMIPRRHLQQHGLPPSGEGVAQVDVIDGIPLAEEAFTGATAHHVLQMVAWPDLVPCLAEIRRVLKPDAWLRVSVPDFPGAYAAALDGDRDWFPIADELEPSIDGKLVTYLTQCGASRSLFTGPWLCDLFRRAGFVGVHQADHARTEGPVWLTQLDNRPAESIYVEGRRP